MSDKPFVFETYKIAKWQEIKKEIDRIFKSFHDPQAWNIKIKVTSKKGNTLEYSNVERKNKK